MSRKTREKITCPKCGKENDFILWQSLNGEIDPEAQQKLLDGTLFRFQCENCGYEAHVDYGMLYHDMAHQAMVYYVRPESVEQTKKMMEEAEGQFGSAMSGYKKRVVTSQNSLREKAILFQHGLDDRVVEICKLFYLANASEQFPKANITEVFFSIIDDDTYLLEFFGDESFSAEIPRGVYEETRKSLAEKLEAAGDSESVVNLEWAMEFLRK